MRNITLNAKFQYISNLFSVNNTKLINIRNSIIGNKQYHIQLSPMETQILQLLIRMKNIKCVVEIGTLVGYSTTCMAEALPNDGHIYSIEYNEENVKKAQENFHNYNLSHKITIIHGKALQKLDELIQFSPFDMIFIDADKSNYCNYLDWAEKYIRPGGLIVADNTLLFDSIYKNESDIPKGISKKLWQVIRNFNLRLSDSSKYCSTLIPTNDGMTIALKLK